MSCRILFTNHALAAATESSYLDLITDYRSGRLPPTGNRNPKADTVMIPPRKASNSRLSTAADAGYHHYGYIRVMYARGIVKVHA